MTGQWRRIRAVPPAACRTVLAVAALACILLLAAGCGKRRQSTPAPAPKVQTKTESGVVIKDSSIVFPLTGPPVWTADVGEIKATGDPGKMELKDVKCRLYREGREALYVEAERGDAVQQDKAVVVRLTGKIRADEKKHGLTMTAEKFEWSSQYDRISAVNVQLLGGGLSHRANRGVFSTDLTRATFTGRVTTRTVESQRR
ncbi:MAG: LPS export ABC transporter periplasmic protein LptC [Armatimonadota bacterium]